MIRYIHGFIGISLATVLGTAYATEPNPASSTVIRRAIHQADRRRTGAYRSVTTFAMLAFFATLIPA